MSLYQAALTVHVLAAIIGVGPTFAMPFFSRLFRTPGPDTPVLTGLMNRIGIFPRIGFPLQIVTGLYMGSVSHFHWELYWLRTALFLVVLILVLGLAVMAPLDRKMAQLLPQLEGEAGRTRFAALARRLHTWNLVQAAGMALIILLMITKPF